MEDSKDQRRFTKDLIDAGYKVHGSENENLNGHQNEKKRLRNVWLQEKTRSKCKCNQNKNEKIEKIILRLLLIRV